MSVQGTFQSTTQVASSTPFDNAGLTFNSTDVQAALKELRDHVVFDQRTQATTLNGTLTLTSADVSMQYLTGSATGYSVQMPDATTLFLSQNFKIVNTTGHTVTLKDGSGAVLFVLAQSAIGELYLEAQGSAAGTWVVFQTGINTSSGVISYNIISNTNFASSANADTLITGMALTPQEGTYAVWYNSQNTATGAGQQMNITLFNNGAAIADSKRSVLSTSGTHIFQMSTQTISSFDGVSVCDARMNPNGNSITVGARSLLLIRLGV